MILLNFCYLLGLISIRPTLKNLNAQFYNQYRTLMLSENLYKAGHINAFCLSIWLILDFVLFELSNPFSWGDNLLYWVPCIRQPNNCPSVAVLCWRLVALFVWLFATVNMFSLVLLKIWFVIEVDENITAFLTTWYISF